VEGPAELDRVGERWDHGDSVFPGSVGSAETRAPQAAAPIYRWVVQEGSDGKSYRYRLNHNGFYLGKENSMGCAVKADGGFAVAGGDPILAPTTTASSPMSVGSRPHDGLRQISHGRFILMRLIR
jgi:hypothetical protein